MKKIEKTFSVTTVKSALAIFSYIWTLHNFVIIIVVVIILSNIYNMNGRAVSDIQTRAEGEWLYIWYNTDAHVVYSLGYLYI